MWRNALCAETISGSAASQPVSQTAQVIVLPAVGSHLGFNLEPPAGKKAAREKLAAAAAVDH